MTVAAVVYHARTPWPAATALSGLYLGPAALVDTMGPHLPRFAFTLDDLAATSDDALRARPMAALPILVLWTLKHTRHEPDIIAALRGVVDLVCAAMRDRHGAEVMAAVFNYIREVGSALDLPRFGGHDGRD
ncbi:Rpn family recombination-promoting nuclease/putative transposase [Haliangium sp.]|uniref:Rpn family recombination-promoting nuclease/putative transposase n=1 Tax=Haliangium sp. TaxID=2663208 RepID=UPI003D14A3F6